MLEQWFRMGEATDLEGFKNALRMMAVPMWHANYADDKGHLMFVFDGLVPKRNGHDYNYWSIVVAGDTSVCAIEFGPTQQARCTLGYGNASQPGSGHLEDQLPLMVQKTLHTVWRERNDVEAHLEHEDRF